MSALAVRCTNKDKPHIARHLISLDDDARDKRFFGRVRDQTIENYVERLDFSDKDVGYAVWGADLDIIGFTHLHLAEVESDSITAEVGMSVSDGYRGKGVGQAMLERMISFCHQAGVKTIYMECLASNTVMKSMATKIGCSVVRDEELIGTLELNPTSFERMHHIAKSFRDDQVALVDLSMKKQAKAFRDTMLKPVTAMVAAMEAFNNNMRK